MNLVFHTTAALTTGYMLSTSRKSIALPWVATGGFVLGILLHGLLDVLPHNHPFHPFVDVALSPVLFLAGLAIGRRYWLTLSACYLGNIIPDLIDHGPAALNRLLGTSLPTHKFFPYHWPGIGGDLGAASLASTVAHVGFLLFTLAPVAILVLCKKCLANR